MVDDQLLDVFFSEADVHLSELESDLLSLEERPEDADLINRVFRHAHSLKGSAGLVGFVQVAEIMHLVESNLDKLRSNEARVEKDLISGLLHAVDIFRGVFRQLQDRAVVKEGNEYEQKIESLRNFLTRKLKEEDEIDDLLLKKQTGKKIQNRIQAWQLRQSMFSSPGTARKRKIGDMLVEQGLVTLTDIKEALSEQKKTGEILIANGKITEDQLRENLEKQVQEHEYLRSKVIKVDIDKLEKLEKLINKLWNGFAQVNLLMKTQGSSQHISFSVGESLEEIGMDIHLTVLSMRLVSVEEAFPSFKRVVRDMASEQGKKVKLVMQGGEIKIDKSVLENMFDPISHLLRNAVKHGIELPEKRFAKGKEETGTIWLDVSKTPKSIVFKISDDGKGINNKEVLKKAAELDLLGRREVTDESIYDLLFQPGLTTSEEIDGVSGRGVGLDVVKRNVMRLGGLINVTSEKENGTTFSFEFPLESVIRKPSPDSSDPYMHRVS